MTYQHFEKKIQDLSSTLESDKEDDSEEMSDNDDEEVAVGRRRKTRNKKPILDESEDEDEEEDEDELPEDADEDDSENDEVENEQEDETWKTEIKLMLEDIPNLTSRQKERKASEFLQLPKEEVLNKLEELNGRSSHRSSRPTRERRAPKRYHISDDDESDFEDAKENVKPAKRQKITRNRNILESDDRSDENDSEEQNSDNEENFEIDNSRQNSSSRRSRRRTARRSKNLLDDEENFAEFDDFEDSFTAERPVRERKRPTRFSEDSHDSTNKKSVYAEGRLDTVFLFFGTYINFSRF